MNRRRHIPMRTCIGCQKRDEKPRLVRVAVANGRVVADARGVLPGRGAYLHPSTQCVSRAAHRSLARALRASVRPADAEAVRSHVLQHEMSIRTKGQSE